MSQEEFIQLCILCGCDYSETIKGIGPVSALKLINEHRSIASSIPHLGKKFRYYKTDV
jgi:flap endonuclease-1